MSYNYNASTESIYIHWPFCPYRCHFCPFVALAGQDQYMRAYHDALCDEIINFARKCDRKLTLKTIYFGGGTPSTYPDELLLDMFGRLKDMFVFDESTEVTLEVNPGTVRPEQIQLWKDIGINRLSVGVQSLKDSALKSLNRHQTAQDVYNLLELVKGTFENISVDLILGLPDVTQKEWKEIIQEVVTWPISHISMYFLMVHENTLLYFKVKSNKVVLPNDKSVVDLYYFSRDMLHMNGFNQYEVSSFARPGFESKHNTAYWERNPFKGFGLGAWSFDGISRLQNEKNLMLYVDSDKNDGGVQVFAEQLTSEQIRIEKIMLGLRRTEGIRWDFLTQGLSQTQLDNLDKTIRELKNDQLIKDENGYLQLTAAGLVVEHEIVSKLS